MLNFIPKSLNQAVENLISPIRVFHPDNFARTVIGNLGFGDDTKGNRRNNFRGPKSSTRFTLDDNASENVDRHLNIDKNSDNDVSDRLIDRLDSLINITERGFDKNSAILSSIFEVLTKPPSNREHATHEPSMEAMQAFELYKRETSGLGAGSTGGSSFMNFGQEEVAGKKDPSSGGFNLGSIGTIVKDVIEGSGLLAIGASLRKLLSSMGRSVPKAGEPLPKPPPEEPTPPEAEPLPKPPPEEPTPPELDKNGRPLPPRDEKGRFTKPTAEDVGKSSSSLEGEIGGAADDLLPVLGEGGVETGAELSSLAIPGVGEVLGAGLLGYSLYNLGSSVVNSGTKADKKLRSLKSEVSNLEDKNKNIQQTLKYLVDAHGDQNEITHYVHEYSKNKTKIEQLKKEEPHYRAIINKEFDENYKTPFLSSNNTTGIQPHSQSLLERYSQPVVIHNDNRTTNNYYGSNNRTDGGGIKTYHSSPADSNMITPTTGR